MLEDGDDLTNEEMEGEAGRNVVAHNGWVMDADPLVNFAAPGSLVGAWLLIMCLPYSILTHWSHTLVTKHIHETFFEMYS